MLDRIFFKKWIQIHDEIEYTSLWKNKIFKYRIQEGGLCLKKLTSWRLTREPLVRGLSFLIKKASKSALVKRNSLRFFRRLVGWSTMPMRFGTRFSRWSLRSLLKVASSPIKSRRSALPINGKRQLFGIRTRGFLFTMPLSGNHGKRLHWLKNLKTKAI